jgi:predicted alpha/beta hydrolase family esterase
MNDLDVLILPGWGDSGPEHWQTLWLNENPSFQRVVQRDWVNSDLNEWVETLDRYIGECGQPAILVGHSLSSILIPHWAQRHGASKVVGALMVAPTDVERRETCPRESWGFAPIPRQALPFGSVVVVGEDDPYCDLKTAEELARRWGSEFVNLGKVAHINVASGFGPWPKGKELLQELCTNASARVSRVVRSAPTPT